MLLVDRPFVFPLPLLVCYVSSCFLVILVCCQRRGGVKALTCFVAMFFSVCVDRRLCCLVWGISVV